MAAYTCLFRNSFPWLVVLGSLFAFAHSSSDQFWLLAIFLTSSALILCPVIVSCSKSSCKEESPKLSSDNIELNPVNEPCKKPAKNVADLDEDTVKLKRVDAVLQKESQTCEKSEEKKAFDYLLSSSDALSDSESSHDHTSSSDEFSENDWIFRENRSHSTPCSDGSISDEESLIEIELPTGHYVESKTQQKEQHSSWYNGFQQKCSDCSLESHFTQQTWIDMVNEMNEENLIEIDICMGSIKCSRFEIEA